MPEKPFDKNLTIEQKTIIVYMYMATYAVEALANATSMNKDFWEKVLLEQTLSTVRNLSAEEVEVLQEKLDKAIKELGVTDED